MFLGIVFLLFIVHALSEVYNISYSMTTMLIIGTHAVLVSLCDGVDGCWQWLLNVS